MSNGLFLKTFIISAYFHTFELLDTAFTIATSIQSGTVFRHGFMM